MLKDPQAPHYLPSFFYHFDLIKDTAILTWKLPGASMICNDNQRAKFRDGVIFTDLDNDHETEIWMLSISVCTDEGNGETEGTMHIVMREAGNQYLMSGDTKGQYAPEKYFDGNFAKAPEAFKQYAIRLWKEYVK